jgi:RHS repeat-associated protein
MTSARRGDDVLGEYTYGPDRQRIKKLEEGRTSYYVAPDFEVRDGTAVIYVTLGDTKIAKIEVPEFAATFLPDLAPGTADGKSFTSDPDAQITAGDAWIAQAMLSGVFEATVEVDETVVEELLAASSRRLLAGELPGVTYYHRNNVSSTVASTNSDGQIERLMLHYPFGGSRYQTSDAVGEYGYTGQERDASGLSYHSARFLNTELGAWNSPDPLLVSLRTDLVAGLRIAAIYSYASGNPISRSDSSGLADSVEVQVDKSGLSVKGGGVELADSTSTFKGAIDNVGFEWSKVKNEIQKIKVSVFEFGRNYVQRSFGVYSVKGGISKEGPSAGVGTPVGTGTVSADWTKADELKLELRYKIAPEITLQPKTSVFGIQIKGPKGKAPPMKAIEGGVSVELRGFEGEGLKPILPSLKNDGGSLLEGFASPDEESLSDPRAK